MYERVEKNIKELPSSLVFPALQHHCYFGKSETSLSEVLAEDCYLAQYANKGFIFALFDSFGTLLHIYNNQMFTFRKSDGSLGMVGLLGSLNHTSVQETQLKDPWQIYLFNTLEKASTSIIGPRVTVSKDGKTSQFYRSKFHVGEKKTLLTSSLFLSNGTLPLGFITGLSLNKEIMI